MKKVLLFLGCWAVLLPAAAQKVSLGLKASPGLAWIKADSKNLNGDGSKIGFAYGAIFDLMFTENYGLGSGIFIHHQGGKLEYTPNDSSSTQKFNYKLQYLNVPVTLKMRTNEIGYFRYYGQFGLIPGINLSAKGTYEINNVQYDFDNAKDNINAFNLGLLVGIGTMYNFAGNTSLLLGIEWNNGFTDVFKDGDIEGKNNFLIFNVGAIF